VVVDHCREQIVSAGNGVEITGEMQVHFFHRHHLRHAATRGAALHAEIRPERGFTDADHGLLADPVEAVTQSHRGRGLALARRRRIDRGDEDQLSIGPVFLPGDEVSRNLGLVMAVGNQIFLLDAELGADLHDRFLVRRTGNLDIGLVFNHGCCFLFPTRPHLPCSLGDE
jgi:hypothetical protein